MSGVNHRDLLTRATLKGVWYSLLVAWNGDGTLDEAGFAREVRSMKSTGVHGVYTGGTTGEFYAQNDDDFERITAIACESAHAIGLPVQIGVTALSTRWTIQRMKIAERYGANGVQVALPFWLQLREREAMEFLHAIANACPTLPLVLYQTGRAKLRIVPETLVKLAREVPTFIGMKDTTCSVDEVRTILRDVPDLAIFGGEGTLLDRMQAGGKGAYSAVTGFVPRTVVELYTLAAAGKYADAQPIQRTIKRLLDEVLIPICVEDGLEDSAIDRIQRVAGGHDIGLQCAPPYTSGTQAHVERVINWCKSNAPELLQQN